MAIIDQASQAVRAMPAQSLAAKVAYLSRTDSYAERPSGVTALETHMSWVFLTDSHAYKLKKPVRYDFLDFSTLAARRRDCELEVTLNRRLAGDVYLGVVALTMNQAGRLQLDGAAEVVDWLVKMRRLPDACRLDLMIADHALKADDLRRALTKLSVFYRDAPAVAVDAASYDRHYQDDIRAAMGDLLIPAVGRARHVKRLAAFLMDFLHEHARLFKERRIIEAHGDLRPEHIFLLSEPLIIDCLEFNRAFRLLDPAEELSFLAMECDLIGAPEVGTSAFDIYAEITGDRPPPSLIAFYKSFRAFLRARIAICHLKDEHVRLPEKWPRQAKAYLDLAENYRLAAP